jgi:hypothetical protein
MKEHRRPRYRTGLRNRDRNGIGTYSRTNKTALADHYARYDNGIQKFPDKIRPGVVD